MLGACTTCVRLQLKVTTSGARVKSWMILFFWFLFFILLFLFVCLFYFFVLMLLLTCLLMCAFKFVLLLSLFWFLFVCFFSFVCLFSFLEGNANSISMWAGAGWSYNHLLVRKLASLILKFYINLKCDREVWL